jgi:hypothetical protein
LKTHRFKGQTASNLPLPNKGKSLNSDFTFGARKLIGRARLDLSRHIECARETFENGFGDVMRFFTVNQSYV